MKQEEGVVQVQLSDLIQWYLTADHMDQQSLASLAGLYWVTESGSLQTRSGKEMVR